MDRFTRPQFTVPALVVAVGAAGYFACDQGCTEHDVGLVFMIAGAIALVIALGVEFLEPRR